LKRWRPRCDLGESAAQGVHAGRSAGQSVRLGGVDCEKWFLLEGDELSEWVGPDDGQVVIGE